MTQKQYIYLIILLVLGNFTLQAQDTIRLSSIITGKLEAVAKTRVELTDGFIAMEGSNVLIYTDPNLDEATVVNTPAMPGVEDETIPTSSASSDQNYIRSISLLEENSSETLSDNDLAKIKHAESIQYSDGLGRISQTVQVAASPDGYDIIQPTVYDQYGREALKYLPYIGSTIDGSYQDASVDDCINYYNKTTIEGRETDSKPYATTEFDNSPLNRVVGQYGVGADWYDNDKYVTSNYTTNTSEVKNWDEEGNSDTPYAAGTLYVTTVTDENGNTTKEYKDKLGKVVLKETINGEETLKTYYVYDNFGLLRVVIPPLATSGTDNELCYYYTYDERHRMITKKIPGAEKIYLVYDSKDRLVLTQDGKMREENSSEYLFTKYDQLNRPVMTGKVYLDDDLEDIRDDAQDASSSETFSSSNSCYGYKTNESYPKIDKSNVLTVTWYDNYDYQSLSDPESLANCTFDNYTTKDNTYGTEASTMIKGMVTGSLVKVLPVNSNSEYEVADTVPVTAIYYDDYGNAVRTVSSNFRGGYDITLTSYEDITYRVLSTCEVHKSNNDDSAPLTLTKKYSYDHMGRLLQTTCQIDDGDGEENEGEEEIVLNAMQYNELGEVVAKYLYSENTDITTNSREFVQRVDYDYNIRGWLTAINDPSLSEDNDVFGLNLYYNNSEDLSATAQYNGNISAMTWATSEDADISGYTFSYDSLNRLTEANYGTGASIESDGAGYNVSIPAYDANGNILSLERYYDGTEVDSLTYTYAENSNQLASVTDATSSHDEDVADFEDLSDDDYVYDANGNMTYDGSRGNDVDYNILNLPNLVMPDSKDDYGIYYIYDASGTKLAKIVKDGTDKDLQVNEYLGSLVYRDYDLSFIQTEEGRLMDIESENTTYWHYEYNLKDHLGNTRFVFGGSLNSGNVDVLQTTSYYPFGMIMKSEDFSTTITNYQKNKYLYNGKEYQDDDLDGNKLGLYDYGNRYYDPSLGRWHVIDNKAEKYYGSSPYSYAGNNPVIFVDYDGNDYGIKVDMENQTITINQTFYTDGTKKTTNLMQKSATYFNGQSGKYGLQTKEGTFKVNYNVNVVEGGSFHDNYLKARADNEANYVETDYGSPGALTIMGDYGRAEEGGDYVVLSDNEEIVNEGVYQHEELHTQGVSHNAIGAQGTELNAKAVGATLEYAGKNSDNLNIKVKNSSNRDQLKTKKAMDQPKVSYSGDDIKLKGSIVEL